jgi:hypothetical protein
MPSHRNSRHRRIDELRLGRVCRLLSYRGYMVPCLCAKALQRPGIECRQGEGNEGVVWSLNDEEERRAGFERGRRPTVRA